MSDNSQDGVTPAAVPEFTFEGLPSIARMEDNASIQVSGAKYNVMQNALMKVAFMEKVLQSKCTVFEKTIPHHARERIYHQQEQAEEYTYLCYGKDELTVKFTQAHNEATSLRAEIQRITRELTDTNAEIQRLIAHYTRTQEDLRSEVSRLTTEKVLILKRGLWARIRNYPNPYYKKPT